METAQKHVKYTRGFTTLRPQGWDDFTPMFILSLCGMQGTVM